MEGIKKDVLFRVSYSSWNAERKKHVNRDSRIAAAPILQSSFFEEVCCLILACLQRKLRGHIEFLNFDAATKKNQIDQKIKRSRPILTKFSIKHHIILLHSLISFQLVNSKFA